MKGTPLATSSDSPVNLAGGPPFMRLKRLLFSGVTYLLQVWFSKGGSPCFLPSAAGQPHVTLGEVQRS